MSGEGTPAFYSIQILSVTGQVVKEISAAEIGPLAVGTHRINYEWDGTDSNGAMLPGGVYFYHMTVRDENEVDYQHLPQPYDPQVSKKGWGKLVILR